MALQAGINFALEANILPVEFEVDCKEVARLYNTNEPYWTEEGSLVNEINTTMIACGINNIQFRPRECNIIVHCLAKAILFKKYNFYCLETGPDWLQK